MDENPLLKFAPPTAQPRRLALRRWQVVALTLIALILLAGAGYVWLWPVLQDLPLNIVKPEFVLTMVLGLVPILIFYYVVGPDYFSRRAQICFFLIGATIVMAATIIAVVNGNTERPVMIPLIAAALFVIAAFGRRALYGPDPDYDWWV